MDYYDYDTFCRPRRGLKDSPIIEWPQHSYQHNSLLSPDHGTPQEELDGFMNYPQHQQQRSFDTLNLPRQQVLHNPYSAHNTLLSHDDGTPQEESRGFTSYPRHQQPRSYDSLNLPQRQVLHSPYSGILQLGGNPNFASVIHQDSMEVPLLYRLEGQDDDRRSFLSSLPRQLGSTSGPPAVSDHVALTIVIANY